MHGIPNTPVDVYANGEKILSGFTFKTVAGPLQLPAGSYAIAVRKAGSAAASAPVLSAAEQVTAGGNATIVAGLTASGTPVLTAFANDAGAAGTGKGRLVVRHVAEAPAVDVHAGSSTVISGLASGQQQALDVPAGTVPAKVTLAGQTAAVLGPVNVPVTAGMGTVVYAIGSAAGRTLTAVTQQYPLGGAPSSAQAGSGVLPTGVQGGGSLAIPPDPSDVGWWAGGGLPGEPTGAVILVGHINSAVLGPGALLRLQDARPGTVVTVVASGQAYRYRVVALRAYAKTSLPISAVFGQQVAPRLVSCGGPFDASTGHYLDNIVAYAVPTGTAP